MTLVGSDGGLPTDLDRLAGLIGSSEVTVDPEPVDEHIVTVVVGQDFDPSTIG